MLSINIEPRISESDGLQHISNTVLPVWFEKGREPIFRLFTKNLFFNEWALILAHIDIDYKQQIYYQFPVTVYTWIEAIGSTSFTVGHSAEQQDQMYSSGTTGKPKCIVHGAGGTLLQHSKEHFLRTDISRDDVLFYFTTCGWMMWHWLVSGLYSGCQVVLYDGSPFAPEKTSLDVRIVLFVILTPGLNLNDELSERIKLTIQKTRQ